MALLLPILSLFACGSGTPEPVSVPVVASNPPVEATMSPVPPLPDGIYLQFANQSTGWVYRVAEDGRFLVTPKGGSQAQQRPMSKLDPGPVLSEQGMLRLRAAVESSGFFTLEDRVGGGDPVPAHAESEAVAQELAFTVHGADGPKTVTVRGALAVAASLGPLEPLFTALDLEALGGWSDE